MRKLKPPRAILFLDFDGTVTCCDVVDIVLEAYADPKWMKFEAEWRAGRMGSRDCLRAQMALMRATKKQVDTLLDTINLDEGLGDLLETCSSQLIPVHVISDGFDYFIDRILSRPQNGLTSLWPGVRVCASHLAPNGYRWCAKFPFFDRACGHGCATCKPAAMRLLNRSNAPAIFVGDGLSDQYAVRSAELVFAKNELAGFCCDHSIEHEAYHNLADVSARLSQWLAGRVFSAEEEKARATA
ncbi:MAG TPA: haloacid dehalogenase-like hydrolase [Pyrinomonadaceae bacterium]|nr:haloacid dehalogenase-like hydrolase [Pyrinomonadaceae bacterium]